MTPEQAVELLPCPFCGEQPRAIRERSELFDLARIWCDNDECFGPRTTAANLEDATAQWNKRAPQPLVGVQRPEDVARIIEIVNTSIGPLNATERADLTDEISAVLALLHTGQPQEGWRRDYENAPSEPHEFFLVRQVGLHPGFGKPFIPAIVQQIDGQLFAPDNEIEPLIFGHGQPKPDWHDAGLEWRPFPADWLSAAPASPRAEGE